MTIRIPIISEFQGKGFKDAQRQTSLLDKSLKRLGATLLAAFSVRKIATFTKNAIKAFAEEDKAVQALALNLRNLGLAYDVKPVEEYISKLEKSSAVADDQLRPAFQQLIGATKDMAMSQELLSLALDISAGTGKSLSSVVQALSRAYLGTNTSLQRLNIGLSKADLATKSFDDIVDDLSNRFTGQAAAAADTYAGKMDILKNASNNAQEILGEKLTASIEKLLDTDNGVPALAASFEQLATDVGNVVLGISDFISLVKDIPGMGGFDFVGFRNKAFRFMFPQLGAFDFLKRRGEKAAREQAALEDTRNRDAARYEGMLKKRVGNEKKITGEKQKQNKLDKDRAKLDKAAEMFDDQRISIAAALKNESLDRNEILRLELKKALINENADRAESLAKKLKDSQDELTRLGNIKPANPFQEWIDSLDKMQRQLSAFNVSPTFLAQSSTADAAASMISMGTKTNNDAILESGVNLLNGWIFSGLMASGQAELNSLMAEQEAMNAEASALAAARAAGATININVTGTGGLDEQTKKAVVDAVVEASSLGYGTGWFRTTGAYTV